MTNPAHLTPGLSSNVFHMPEAVIVAHARSPIGRAGKGSLKDVRPDELSRQIVTALLAKVPELDPKEIEDIHWGIGQPLSLIHI